MSKRTDETFLKKLLKATGADLVQLWTLTEGMVFESRAAVAVEPPIEDAEPLPVFQELPAGRIGYWFSKLEAGRVVKAFGPGDIPPGGGEEEIAATYPGQTILLVPAIKTRRVDGLHVRRLVGAILYVGPLPAPNVETALREHAITKF